MFLKQQQDSQQKKTLLLTINDVVSDADKLNRAAELIRRGGLVAFPTETVYGLGANALDPQAVKGIFAAKGRPQDNPLIIHLVRSRPDTAICKKYPAGLLRAVRALFARAADRHSAKTGLHPDGDLRRA